MHKIFLLKRIGHILLALLILVSSSGVLLNKHYCQGILRSQSFFVQPPLCHSEVQENQPSCPYHPRTESLQDNGCCDTRSTYLKVSHPQFHSFTPLKLFPGLPTVLPIVFIPVRVLPPSDKGFSDYTAFDLPPPTRPIYLRHRVFRI
ncbi:MAG: HYC_CC_PP family protein [Haliscomenobacter sp.]